MIRAVAPPLAVLCSAVLVSALAACGRIGEAAGGSGAFRLHESTIAAIQAAIRSGEVTSTELVELYLARIKAYNGTCVEQPAGILGPITTIPSAGQINALSTLNLRPVARRARGFDDRKARSMTDSVDADPSLPDALEVAADLDRRFEESGELVGPLHGVVIAIKDQYDTRDMRTTSGADVDYANDRPPDDATFVQRLRDAGAIVIAKANMGEYASAIPRSSFGGVFCNPYDTERSPRGSSSGSGSAVGANLVTCAIAEETGSSIRGPASAASSVGISPTQELVSRDGMVQQGINTRVGPICRTVEDAARVLDVIAGYDPADELTAFAMGRMPTEPYHTFAAERRLEGLRIGVVREYMDTTLFTRADVESIEIVARTIPELARLGATVVDPGPGSALFGACLPKHLPMLQNSLFTVQHDDLFPVDAQGRPVGDHVATLVELAADTARVPAGITLRDLGNAPSPGEGRYWMNRYLRERGDTAVRTTADLITRARFHQDPNFPDRRAGRVSADEDRVLDLSRRMHQRFAVQQVMLQCMAEQDLDALVYPSTNLPPVKLDAPPGPTVNGRNGTHGLWNLLGAQGFPVITVPAGFTTEVYDLVRTATAPPRPAAGYREGNQGDRDTELVGPTRVVLPVGMDILGAPFAEPTLIRIAAAFEAATRHRRPPPDFGPLPGEP
jgi:Asp-tRNA(Asn)/Glu-tRNA(Gln) amidotransferase A subunit family amidase